MLAGVEKLGRMPIVTVQRVAGHLVRQRARGSEAAAPRPRPILSLDVGTRRIGVALCAHRPIVQPLDVLDAASQGAWTHCTVCGFACTCISRPGAITAQAAMGCIARWRGCWRRTDRWCWCVRTLCIVGEMVTQLRWCCAQVVGWPIEPRGFIEGPQCRKTLGIVRELAERTQVRGCACVARSVWLAQPLHALRAQSRTPLVFMEEAWSSEEAGARATKATLRASSTLDHVAAAVILEVRQCGGGRRAQLSRRARQCSGFSRSCLEQSVRWS